MLIDENYDLNEISLGEGVKVWTWGDDDFDDYDDDDDNDNDGDDDEDDNADWWERGWCWFDLNEISLGEGVKVWTWGDDGNDAPAFPLDQHCNTMEMQCIAQYNNEASSTNQQSNAVLEEWVQHAFIS